MTETKRMKSPSKSFDVFEFKEEDELAEMAAKKLANKFGRPHSFDVSGSEVQLKENDAGRFGAADATGIDCNHDSPGSVTPIKTEDFARDTPELSHDLLNDFKSHEQAAEIKSNVIESLANMECRSSPGATMPLEDYAKCSFPESSPNDKSVLLASDADCHSSPGATMPLEDYSKCSFPVSSPNDKSVCLASDADESMSERSPSAIAESNASSEGPSPDNCSGGCELGDEMGRIVFYPDYIDYGGAYYMDSVVSFSRSFIEARSKTIYGRKGTFHFHLDIEDIVKIESQWSARYETGTINIYFISKDAAQDDIIHNASGLRELKFPAVDSNWYEKQEAIESLDVRYKALWTVQLDTGMEKSSALPEGESMMLRRRYFPNFETPFEEVIYPKGDPDAVSINKRDVDLLLPDTFVNDTIIDFYIKYLKTRQNVEERSKFHFFNSFFFRKLADMDKDPSSAFDGKAAFQRVRKWTRKVNLLEKDFIFIPVNYSLHWSLIVICYFSEVACYKDTEDDKAVRVPCILHMDSLRGNHLGLKDLIQSYLWEEWKERQKGTCEDLYSKFRNLKFIPLELPQQQNSYDCGLFLLHYVELFLEELPTNFSIYKITPSSKFLQPDWFPPGEASMKRTNIERLINGLLDTQSGDCPVSSGTLKHGSSECLDNTHDYENGLEFPIKSGPSGSCCESSLSQVRQGIEMSLFPASSTRTPGLVVSKEMFKQTSALESFNDASWGVLESRASLHEFKRPVPVTEEEVEASDCFVPTQLTEPLFHHLNGVTQEEEPLFPYSSGDFRLEPIHQPPSKEFVESSPVTSGSDSVDDDDVLEVEADDDNDEKWQSVEAVSLDDEQQLYNRSRCISSSDNMEQLTVSFNFSGQLLNAEASHNLAADINDQNGDPFFLKNLQEFNQEVKTSNDEGNEGAESDEQQHTAKRMRITPLDDGEGLNCNLSQDLNL